MISTMPYSSNPFSTSRIFYSILLDSGSVPDESPPLPSDRQRVIDVIKEAFVIHNTQQINLNAIWHRNNGSVADFSINE